MKKIPLFAALCAASICSLASAQTTVQVYGRLYPFLIDEKGSGATAVGTPVSTLSIAATGSNAVPHIKGMQAGNSHLGFRGSENLGGGMKAKFQLEGVVDVDSGGASGFRFGRNTFVAIEGGFGEVSLGNMDTVFKDYGDTLGILGLSSGTPASSSSILRRPGFGTSSASRFHERRQNSIRYETPTIAGGLEFGVQVATQENPNPATGIGPAKTLSFGVKWDSGPFYVALAHEIHDNWFGGSSNVPSPMRNNGQVGVESKDTATQFTIEWRMSKVHKFEVDVIRKDYDEGANVTGRFKSYSNTAYLIGMENRWNDQWRTAAHIVKSNAGSCTRINAVCSTEGLEGTKVTVGAAYYLNRRTYLFSAYNHINNGKSARYSNTEFGNPNPGEDTRNLMLGMSKAF